MISLIIKKLFNIYDFCKSKKSILKGSRNKRGM